MTDGGAGAAGGLVGAADRLVAEEAVGDGEYLALLCKQRARLDARIALETAAFDASGAWADDGARTAATWVARRCRLPKAEAKAQVRLGRHLRHLPVARAAFLAGEVNCAQVRRLGTCRRPETEEALAKDEPMLVDHARTLRYEDFERVCAYWLQLALPDEVEADAQAQCDMRSVWLEPTSGGVFYGRTVLDPIAGTIVASELKRLERSLFDADWAEAKSRLPDREPTPHDLARTSAQRGRESPAHRGVARTP